MIIVKITGGLGNQMFQYALGRKLSIANEVEFKLDINEYQSDKIRSYTLNKFNISENIATSEEIESIKNPHGILSEVFRRVRFKITKNVYPDWEPWVFKKKDKYYFDGFWQTERYFLDIRSTLLHEFTLKTPLEKSHPDLTKEVEANNSLSIHIRRGDYLTNADDYNFKLMRSTGYYQKSLEYLVSRTPNAKLYVFSDDPEWVQEHLDLPADTHFATEYNLTDYQELILMSKCKHNIISNSTFSWWGAWLNNFTNKVVIAPSPWTSAPDNEKRHGNIIPDTWKTLPKS